MGEKILIVDDVIASRGLLELIVRALQDLGLSYEIATLSFDDSEVINATYKPEIDIKQLEDKLGSEIIYGEYVGISSLYGSRQMIGVHKSPASVFSQPLRKEIPIKNIHNIPLTEGDLAEKEIQDLVILDHTRKLISKISDQLVVDYIR